MEPRGFVVNWNDSPRQAKFYPDTDGFALPRPAIGPDLPHTAPGSGTPAFTLPVLSDLLLNSYAHLGRRLRVNANGDAGRLPGFHTAKWSRGAASGGGIYPVSVYWVTGRQGPAVPGVYHYFPFLHTMKRLYTGDVTAEVAAALGERSVADQYFVLGLKFWQNSFKYASFSYHAVGFDLGTIVQTWRMLARTHGLVVTPRLWFDEPRLGRLLNLSPEQEGIFAVVPLSPGRDDPGPPEARADAPRVRYADLERSRTVLSFETVNRVHAATVVGCVHRPDPEAVKAAEVLPRLDREPVPLPVAAPPRMGPRRALRTRQSSFGRFTGATPTDLARLSAILYAGTAAADFACDVIRPGPDARLVKHYVFANHVGGLDPGAYEYDPAANALRRIRSGSRAEFLQTSYTLANYNVEQAGAVIVPVVRVPAMLDALADRGYRLATAIVGAAAQAFSTTCSALGLGCGVALGLDTLAYIEELELRETDEVPMLIVMVGHERACVADYRYDLI
jgi:SagB-type dehydrogenase family enzyme